MRYRKIDPRIWNDERVRDFTDDGKLAFLFLLTHPAMTAVGAMRGTLSGLAAELRWPVKRLERALGPAIEAGMVEANAGASYIGLRRFLRYNHPESPNVARAWASALELVPECPERHALVARCRENLRPGPFREAFEEGLAEAFGEAFGEAKRHPSPNPEPEPEPEQEQKQEQEQEGSPLPPLIQPMASNGDERHTARRVRL